MTEPAVISFPLTVRTLTPEDLPECGWSGSALHLKSVAEELERVAAGDADYLVACPPSGLPIAKAGVTYVHPHHPGAGVVHQFAVHPALQSVGIGTALMAVAEDRIRARGLTRAELGVEENNPRARALYERLGYTAFDRRKEGWEQQREDGSVYWYETVCTVLRKEL